MGGRVDGIMVECADDAVLGAVGEIDALVLGSQARQACLASAVQAGQARVARVSGGVAGYAVVAPSFFGRWFIELLIVHPKYRRQGIASWLNVV
jgi:ribosomal protein S18 acetylase RimI-like enzyme